jgi:hypothetical protein
VPLIAAQAGFYEAVAQVLPVLLLVMTVGEARLQKRKEGHGKQDLGVAVLLTLAMAAFVVAGEIASLRVLMNGSDSETEEAFAVGGIGAGVTYVVLWVMRSSFDEYRKDFSVAAQKRQIRLQLLVAAAVILGVFVGLK